jgi:hypothetical protein
MVTFDIDRARRLSLRRNLENEIIEVEVIRPIYRNGTLKFTIDRRLIQTWIRNLTARGDEFRMTNTITGATLWSKTLTGDLTEIAKTMGSLAP